ncbi:hypothetical protein IFR05_008289 [Cadophora sp. M221]|nr:hypothetical protein IFR05_008289 [Cadophora sp. M221]
METPEADSLILRFFADTISNLTRQTRLPPNTPTRPKSMRPARSTSISAPGTKTRPSTSFISQKREFEFSQQNSFDTLTNKRRTSWCRERHEYHSPDRLQKNSGWDHWSPATKPRRGTESAKRSSKAYTSVEFGKLRPSDEDGKVFGDWVQNSGGQSKKEVTREQKMETKKKITKEDLPILNPQAIKSSPSKRNCPRLQSVSVAGYGLDTKEDKKKVCYNCGKKGHWTMDCSVVGAKTRGAGGKE